MDLIDGEYYMQRDGEELVKIERDEKTHKWPIIGNNGHRYKRDGTFTIFNELSPLDLVEHVPKTDPRHPDYTTPKPAGDPDDPGEGWRLLEPGELVEPGDEVKYYSHLCPEDQWEIAAGNGEPAVGQWWKEQLIFRRRISKLDDVLEALQHDSSYMPPVILDSVFPFHCNDSLGLCTFISVTPMPED